MNMIRTELLFLALLFSLVCMAYGSETENGMPPLEVTVPLNGHINASETLSQISIIGSDVASASFSLYWQNEESDLEMTLRSPSGLLINQSVQMPTIYKKDKIDTYYIVENPETGNWTAMIEAKNVSAKGEDYTFFVAKVLGNESIPANPIEPGNLSETGNQTNIT
jgi:hypothetical protein